MENKNVIKATRQEIMEILGVTPRNLKEIEKKNQLQERLNANGYKFIEKVKKGRNYEYYMEIAENIDNGVLLKSVLENVFKVRKYLSFSEYYTIRYVFAKAKWQGASQSAIAEKVGVSERTISNWDNILKEKGLIKQDGYYYYKKDMNTFEEHQICEEEYSSYWRNKKYIKAMKSLQNRYDRGEITWEELCVAIAENEEIRRSVEGKYCFRIKKYIIDALNVTCKDYFELIKKVFLTDIGLEYIELKK
ncbi:helix-turn-helix domain-containing protein [Clostridium beijerinckii]|uniref:helix-turn-helix domain-containing protein n=1 Tax=Clostridium beijerinckii TaxID=1520 RepID=UPI00156DBFDB|nr:helix-turn-helix domain-containing protein [Clostridium beijerinckii]NRT73616.1 transposase [Clostridium beijerinckii]